MKIILNEIEQELCKLVSQKRFEMNRTKKIKNNKIGPQSDSFTDLNGFGAELAMAKLLGIYPDTEIRVRSALKDNGDLIYNNLKLDIKTTKYKNGKLIVHPSKKKNPADIYILLIGKFPEYTFVGGIKSNEVFKQDNIKNLGYGLTYAVDQDKLINSLLELL